MPECESASEALPVTVVEPLPVAVSKGVLEGHDVIEITLDKDT